MQEKNIRDRIAKVQMLMGAGKKSRKMQDMPYCAKPYNPNSEDDMHILPYPEEDMHTLPYYESPPFNPEGGENSLEFSRTRAKSKKFVKGSPEAKAHMAKIRAMKGKGGRMCMCEKNCSCGAGLKDTMKKVGRTALKVAKVAVPLGLAAYAAHQKYKKPVQHEIGYFPELDFPEVSPHYGRGGRMTGGRMTGGRMTGGANPFKYVYDKIKNSKVDMEKVKKIAKLTGGALTALGLLALLIKSGFNINSISEWIEPSDIPRAASLAEEIFRGLPPPPADRSATVSFAAREPVSYRSGRTEAIYPEQVFIDPSLGQGEGKRKRKRAGGSVALAAALAPVAIPLLAKGAKAVWNKITTGNVFGNGQMCGGAVPWAFLGKLAPVILKGAEYGFNSAVDALVARNARNAQKGAGGKMHTMEGGIDQKALAKWAKRLAVPAGVLLAGLIKYHNEIIPNKSRSVPQYIEWSDGMDAYHSPEDIAAMNEL